MQLHHAKVNADKWPVAEDGVRKNSLVDDIWLFSDNLLDLYTGKREIIQLMSSMGVQVHKWGSNCPEILEDVPENKKAMLVKLSDDDQLAIKVLGMIWDTQKDTFLFAKSPSDLAPWTQRTITSSAGQLFNSTVLVGPTTLPAKLLIQNAWRYQPGWDDPIPECLATKMSLYCKNQKHLLDLEIPRHLGGLIGQGRLVIFTDASNLAQAAVAYWVTESGGVIDANLVAARTKVTGMLQHEHTGRLELMVAVMEVKLALNIAVVFQIPMEEVNSDAKRLGQHKNDVRSCFNKVRSTKKFLQSF